MAKCMNGTKTDSEQPQLGSILANLAHDLKTPLTGIKLFADLLLGEEGGDNGERAKYLAVISSEADRMGRMITNLADLQRLATGQTQWQDEESDIAALIASCAKPFEHLCRAKGIGFGCQSNVDELTMKLDRARFSRLIAGLLGNALRFTESGAVNIALSLEGKTVLLSISDNGPGIPEERLKSLLQPPPEMTQPAKEIGFAFAHCVIGHYRGRFWAESVMGKGTTFHVELPLQR